MQLAVSVGMETPGLTKVAVKNVLAELDLKLSAKAKIVTEQDEEWEELMQRWTDIDKESPGGIVCVSSEEDVLETIKLCLAHRVRFVPKAGGHSPWSTIGADGIIIDLTAFDGIEIEKSTQTVTFQGGVQNKAALAALFASGLCCSFGGANTIGVIPQLLNGGLSVLAGILGYASDAIISARMITAAGELITVSKTQNSELLYALKGAGQHFGLVTSLTLKAAPLSVLNSDDGTVWSTQAIYPATKIADLVKAFEPIVNDPNPHAGGLVVITKDPMGSNSTIVLCALFYIGSTEDATAHYASFKAMEPIMWGEKRVSYANINDDFDPFCVKGGYKRFKLAGLPRFQSDVKVWEKEVEIFDNMIEKCGPGAQHSGIAFEWVGSGKPGRFEESAFGHRGVKSWIECLSWYVDKASTATIDGWEAEAVKIATTGFDDKDVETYQNFSRDTSEESRFPGVERLATLRALKSRWDPEGVFTDVFLAETKSV